MTYKVVEHVFLAELESEVNDLLDKGWQLQGGISVSRIQNNGSTIIIKHYQALIKK